MTPSQDGGWRLRALLGADGVRTLDFLELGSVRQDGERSV